jgi:hypothetical protein
VNTSSGANKNPIKHPEIAEEPNKTIFYDQFDKKQTESYYTAHRSIVSPDLHRLLVVRLRSPPLTA